MFFREPGVAVSLSKSRTIQLYQEPDKHWSDSLGCHGSTCYRLLRNASLEGPGPPIVYIQAFIMEHTFRRGWLINWPGGTKALDQLEKGLEPLASSGNLQH